MLSKSLKGFYIKEYFGRSGDTGFSIYNSDDIFICTCCGFHNMAGLNSGLYVLIDISYYLSLANDISTAPTFEVALLNIQLALVAHGFDDSVLSLEFSEAMIEKFDRSFKLKQEEVGNV